MAVITDEKMKKDTIYELLPPTDPRVLSSIVPFDKDIFLKQESISTQQFVRNMFATMHRYGGIGLSANQVGKPYRMFIMGGQPQIENGKVYACFNPKIIKSSKETVRFKEGCLSFPFLFLDIERPQRVEVEFLDENLNRKEYQMDGIMARCFQHELDHMDGIVFTEKVSKMKYDMAMKKRDKYIKRLAARVKGDIKDDKKTETTNT
tara:strand:+ start:3081 stop:3698 length:618 start_codon:yes stop_codon:yes gene_type:complete